MTLTQILQKIRSVFYTKTETDNLLLGKSNTSHNHNSVYLGINAKASSATTADNGVDSYGSDWIRFKDGVQICAGSTYSVNLAPNELKTAYATFPKSFSSTPNVVSCSSNPHIIGATWGVSVTGCEVYMKSTSSGYGSTFGRYIAFGKWK